MPASSLCLTAARGLAPALVAFALAGCPEHDPHAPIVTDGGMGPGSLLVTLDVAVALQGTDANAAFVPKEPERFQLSIVDQSGQPLFVANREGELHVAPATRTKKGWRNTEPLRVGRRGCRWGEASSFSRLDVEVRGGGVIGYAEGTVGSLGHAIRQYAVTGTVTGMVDGQLPRLVVVGAEHELHPLNDLEVESSHVLVPGTQLTATASSGHTVTLRAEVTERSRDSIGAVRFVTSAPLLPDTTYTIATKSGGLDLQGRMAMPPASFTTQPVAARGEDGFESDGGGVLVGLEVAGRDELPPINGLRSLYSPSSGEALRFTARLAVTPGDKVVRMSYRHVGASEADTSPPNLVVARVIGAGGAIVPIGLPRPPSLTQDPVSRLWLGPVTEIEVPVPAGEEVIVDIARGSGCATALRSPGFQLDDLRVE